MKKIPIHCAHQKVVPIAECKPNPKNPNQHPKRQIQLLAKILKYQGWRNPIVISKRSKMIVKGHARLEAALLNKWDTVPVDFQNYKDDAMEYADMIADNQIAELSEVNLMFLKEDIPSLPESFDYDFLGIPDFDPASLLKSLKDEPKPPDITDNFSILIDVDSEEDLQKLYEEMVDRGFHCKLIR